MLIKPSDLNKTLFQRCDVVLFYGHEAAMQTLGAFFLRDLYTHKQEATAFHVSETDLCQNPDIFLHQDLFAQGSNRFLWVSEVTGKSKELFEKLDWDTLFPFVVLTVPTLRRTSPLIKWAENQGRIAVLGCYDSLVLPFKRTLFPLMARLRGLTVPEDLWPYLWGVSIYAWPDLLEKLTLLVEQGGSTKDVLTKEILAQLHFVPDDMQKDWVMNLLANTEKSGSNFLAKGLPALAVYEPEKCLKNVRRAVAVVSNLLFLKAAERSYASVEQTLEAYRARLFFKEVPFFKKAMRVWKEEEALRFLLKLGEEEKNLKKKEHSFLRS